MKHAEKITPIAAAASALTTLLCCLPLGFAAAATASLGLVVATLRPWLLGLAIVLLGVGFVQMYRGKNACRRRNPANLAILWISTAVVVLVALFPQLVATVAADWLPAR